MSIPTGVDSDAPVRAHHETDIDAPLDTVWQLHADVNAWPSWQTDITAAHIDGAFQPGASFEWTSYGFTVVSTRRSPSGWDGADAPGGASSRPEPGAGSAGPGAAQRRRLITAMARFGSSALRVELSCRR